MLRNKSQLQRRRPIRQFHPAVESQSRLEKRSLAAPALFHQNLKIHDEATDLPIALPLLPDQTLTASPNSAQTADYSRALPPSDKVANRSGTPGLLGPGADVTGPVPVFDASQSSASILFSVAALYTSNHDRALGSGEHIIDESSGSAGNYSGSTYDEFSQFDGSVANPPANFFTITLNEEQVNLNNTGFGPNGQEIIDSISAPTGPPNPVVDTFDIRNYDYTAHTYNGLYTLPVNPNGYLTVSYAPAADAYYHSSVSFSFSGPGVTASISGGTLSVTWNTSSTTQQHYTNTNFGVAGGSFEFDFSETNISMTQATVDFASSNEVDTPNGPPHSGSHDQFAWSYKCAF